MLVVDHAHRLAIEIVDHVAVNGFGAMTDEGSI